MAPKLSVTGFQDWETRKPKPKALMADRVPGLGDQKAEAESLDGRQRALDQRDDDAAEQ
jgi:hypothetical protein